MHSRTSKFCQDKCYSIWLVLVLREAEILAIHTCMYVHAYACKDSGVQVIYQAQIDFRVLRGIQASWTPLRISAPGRPGAMPTSDVRSSLMCYSVQPVPLKRSHCMREGIKGCRENQERFCKERTLVSIPVLWLWGFGQLCNIPEPQIYCFSNGDNNIPFAGSDRHQIWCIYCASCMGVLCDCKPGRWWW